MFDPHTMFFIILGLALVLGKGILEGVILALILRLPKKRSIGIAVLANLAAYAILWMSETLCFFTPLGKSVSIGSRFTLNDAWLACTLVCVFQITIYSLLQWPFLKWLATGRSWRFALGLGVIVQVVLAGGEFLFSLLDAELNFASRAEWTGSTPAFAAPKDAFVYYLNQENTAVFKKPLSGGEEILVRRFPAKKEAYLIVQNDLKGSCSLLLWLPSETGYQRFLENKESRLDYTPLLEPYAACEAPKYASSEDREPTRYYGYDTVYLQKSGAPVVAKAWQEIGGSIYNRTSHQNLWLHVQTAFYSVKLEKLTVLGNDAMIFGDRNFIYLYSIATKRLSLVASGHDPVVVIDNAAFSVYEDRY